MRQHSNPSLWRLTRGERLRYSSAILSMWVGILFLLLVQVLIKAAVDSVLKEEPVELETPIAVIRSLNDWLAGLAGEWGRLETLYLCAGILVCLTAVAGLFQYFRARLAAVASEAIVQRVRDTLFSQLERLPCRFYDQADTGDLVQRCTSDVETVRIFLAAQVVEIGHALLLVLTAFPILYFIDARMAFVAVAVFPVILAFAVYFFRRIKKTFLEMDEAEAEMTTVLQENLTGIRVVRAFAQQAHEEQKFAAKNELYRDKNYRLIRLLGIYWPCSDFLCFTQIAIVVFSGAWFLQRGEITTGSFWLFFSTASMMVWPVRQMGRILTDSGKAVVALGRLQSILAEQTEEQSDSGAAPAEGGLQGGIEVRGLDFRFAGDQAPVLEDVRFSVKPGETLAILGRPGSGKSTIIQLLLRLYDYEAGSIRLDGHELKELGRDFVRREIGVVLQEPFLYSKTIGANLQVGHSGASAHQIAHAAQLACVHDAIEEFESGYDTLVGERGVTLSGGQRQRISLARALLKDPPILVLDDSLSAVDTKTESEILAALERRQQKRTTLIITHRLSSILHADKIIVLDEGRVVQAGTHAELLREEGAYRRLWAIQGSLEEEIESDLGNGLEEAKA